MDRLKMTVSGDPLCYITIECENGERARQVSRWLMAQASAGNIPHQQSQSFGDENASTTPKGRGQTVASRASLNRARKKGGAAGSAATALKKRVR